MYVDCFRMLCILSWLLPRVLFRLFEVKVERKEIKQKVIGSKGERKTGKWEKVKSLGFNGFCVALGDFIIKTFNLNLGNLMEKNVGEETKCLNLKKIGKFYGRNFQRVL